MKNKLILSVLILSSFVSQGFANDTSSIMTVNGKKVSTSFFEYIFNKNNSYEGIEKKTKEEYLELFEAFRLKVAEAEALGLDTVSSYKEELNNYRKQLTPKYLTSTETKDSIVEKEYERLHEDIDVSHILIGITGNSPADTLAAYQIAMGVYRETKTKNFDSLAVKYSIDPSAKQNKGHLGYISALWTVYPFENAAYSTPVDSISLPIRTSFGYHILKINGRRKAPGKRLVAHIMIFTNDTIPGKNEAAEEKIKELFLRTKSGEDFAELAKQYSDDKNSAVNGGQLPWFGTGNMVKEFENAAFSLTQKGQISNPVKTKYGWHIIKLIDTKGIDSFEQLKDKIEQQVTRGDRSEIIANAFTKKLKKEYYYKENSKSIAKLEKLAEKLQWNDSVFYKQAKELKKPLFSFANEKFDTDQLAKFMLDHKLSSATLRKSIDFYAAKELLKHEDSQLEKKYHDFGNLMQEYRDGILLFNISSQEVWDKAAKDTVGLTKYFEEHKDKYKWETPRFKGRILYCRDSVTAARVKEALTQPRAKIDSILTSINRNDTIFVRSEKNLFVKGQNPAVDFYAFNEGHLEPSKDFQVIFVDGKVLTDTPDEYTDVKGAVIQDYQNYLDQKWIESLKTKYPIVINKDALNSIK